MSGWIENIAIRTSSGDGILIRHSFVSAEIHGENTCSKTDAGSNSVFGVSLDVKIV